MVYRHAYGEPLPPGKYVVHKDGDRLNNRIDNLEFAEPNDIVERRSSRTGKRSHNAKLTNEQIDEIIARYPNESLTNAEWAAQYQVKPNVIGAIARRYGLSKPLDTSEPPSAGGRRANGPDRSNLPGLHLHG